jgi:addiction module HigA family antidote
MIGAFKDTRLEALWNLQPVKGFGHDLAKAVRRKLVMLEAATEVQHLRQTTWNAYRATDATNTACGSMINGVCVSSGNIDGPKKSNWWTTTKRRRAMESKKSLTVHPGEILEEEFLRPLNLSQNALALNLRVPAQRINELVRGRRSVTVDTALRLSADFHTPPVFWLPIQNQYALDKAREEGLSARVSKEVHKAA